MGSDGRVYGGTYGGGKLAAFDLKTYKVEDCGGPAPPNMYLRRVSALPDGRILCSFGNGKPTSMIYDPAVKRFSPVPTTLEGVSMGVTWNGLFLAGAAAFRGTALDRLAAPPFPAPPSGGGGWYVDADLTSGDTVYIHQKNALFRYRVGDSALTPIADIDLRGGRMLTVDRSGEVLGIRGQDYFIIRPGANKLDLRPIPTVSEPRPTLFLKCDEKGALWGGPNFGQTLFRLDPRTRKYLNTRTICDGGGEVYDVAFRGGCVYAASYAGGDITLYDSSKPWDQWGNVNPRPLASLGARGYIRPVAGAQFGPDGKLYTGWMAVYGKYGGAIAVTDPDTGATELIENPLGEQSVTGLAVDRRFAYVGTGLSANGLPDKEGEWPRFGVVDLATRHVVFRQEFEHASQVRGCAVDAVTGRVFFASDGVVRLFDAGTLSLAALPADTPAFSGYNVSAPGDGCVYYASGKALVALNLKTGAATRLAEAVAPITTVAARTKGDIYFSCGGDIYRIRREKSRSNGK